jgi:Myb/SANT-like DNA-binding domain
LIAAQEIQSITRKIDLNFTTPEYQQVNAFFPAKTNIIEWTMDQLINRIKILKKEYNNFKESTSRSGCSWDYENHMSVAPTIDILRQICQILYHVKSIFIIHYYMFIY